MAFFIPRKKEKQSSKRAAHQHIDWGSNAAQLFDPDNTLIIPFESSSESSLTTGSPNTHTTTGTTVTHRETGEYRAFATNELIEIGGIQDPILTPLVPFTIFARVVRTRGGANSSGVFASELKANNGPWLVIINSANKAAMYCRSATNSVWASVIGSTALPLNEEVTVQGTWDGSNIRLYVNGGLEATTAHTEMLDLGATADAVPAVGIYPPTGGSKQSMPGEIAYCGITHKYWDQGDIDRFLSNEWGYLKSRRKFWVVPSAAAVTIALTGTAGGSTEADIVTGGKTTIITLTGDTFAAAGTGPIGSTADTQALIDGITSAQTETLGWNNEVRDKVATSVVVRTSSTVATITWTAAAAYDITATETITVTIPAAVLVTSASAVVATPTFAITAVASGTIAPLRRRMMMRSA